MYHFPKIRITKMSYRCTALVNFTRCHLILIVTLFCLDPFLSTARAGIHFTLQSSLSENNLPLSSQNSRSGSASIAFDLGTYFRLGYTHRQTVNLSKGYVLTEDLESYKYRMEKNQSFSNSLDFTIILYYGAVFVPYLQLGVVKKDYLIASAVGEEDAITEPFSLPAVPNAGVGLGIRLNRNFSLKLSFSVSPGLKKTHPLLEAEPVWDTYTSIGISYNI